jgi:general secretion pathway protein H
MTERRRAAGFTLLELIVVVAILAVATALVLPSIGRSSETLRLRSEAGRVAAVIREARLRAVSQRHATRVKLDAGRNTVVVTGRDEDRPLRELTVDAGIRLSVDRGGDTLTFSTRGLTREARWLLRGPGGRQFAVDVEAVTGRVRVAAEDRS